MFAILEEAGFSGMQEFPGPGFATSNITQAALFSARKPNSI